MAKQPYTTEPVGRDYFVIGVRGIMGRFATLREARAHVRWLKAGVSA